MNSITVSIIIPTYNDWKRLSLCISALADQTFAKDRFEVIIVNNNPNDIAPENFALPENCKILTEKKPGSYAARNAALKIAKGEIIGFTDSDCIPDRNWIKNAVDYFTNNNHCSRLAGKVSIFFESGTPTRAELYDTLFAFNQKNYVQNSGTSVTANLFTYKYVFDKIGFFDEKLMSGGDFLWGTIAHKNGFQIAFVENVIVNHPARKDFKELVKKERRVGGSQAFFLGKKNSLLFILLQFIKELLPNLKALKFIFMEGKDISVIDKIAIYIMRQSLIGIRSYEKLRVQLGKKANRA
jgi:glycosyltransferase involved in cell wall biosynthesis